MDELLAQFLIEGRDLVADAHAALHALEREPGSADAVDALFRSTHTLKGSVALFDMAPAETLLHAAETLLVEVRRGSALLGEAQIGALVAAIDQVDRWIDAMESTGRLDDGAAALTEDLVRTLGGREAAAPASDAGDRDLLAALLARPQFAGLDPPAGGTAFRYTPDADCFFRGEDPLATVAAVPGLVAFALLPNQGWPPIEAIDPFRCNAAIEGISTADLDAVRAAFRLMPDQIALARIGPEASPEAPMAREIEATTTMLRVEGAKLDRLARQAGELSVAVHGLDGLAARAERFDRALAGELRRAQAAIERASAGLRGTVAQVRLVSLAPVLRRLPRLARETAAALGKRIAFAMSGDAIEADKQLADALFEPLLHLVRNAVDHGIEPAEARAAAGKPEAGQVSLAIAASGERLLVTLRDDGRGIDPDAIRRAAIARGLVDADAAAALGDQAALRLIFAPGFSTAASVSTVSGRGVGMDAVQRAIDQLQGTIDIESTVGAGTTVRISLPLNAITTRLLTVSAGGQRFGLRLDQIAETLRIAAADIHAVGGGAACVIRDRTVPVLDLGALLGQAGQRSDIARLVVTEVTGQPVALRVDALGERLDALVRERAGLLASVPAIGGTAVLGDGGVLLVLDLPELVA